MEHCRQTFCNGAVPNRRCVLVDQGGVRTRVPEAGHEPTTPLVAAVCDEIHRDIEKLDNVASRSENLKRLFLTEWSSSM
jgi:hypothetical protein